MTEKISAIFKKYSEQERMKTVKFIENYLQNIKHPKEKK